MIRNEMKLFLSRKNILLFFAALAAVIFLYTFQYEKAYEEYPAKQMEELSQRLEDIKYYNTLYGNRVAYLEANEPENERLKPISQSAGIFASLESLCGLQLDYWNDWEEQEDMLRKLQKQADYKAQDAPDKIDPGEGTLFNGTRRDWNQRMLLHEAYEKAKIQEPVNKAVPTGAYVLYQGLGGTEVLLLLLVILLVGWNYDIWSADFDDSTGKILYTLPISRKQIFISRCLIRWGFSMAGVMVVLGELFLCGTVRFGTGLEDFQILNGQMVRRFSLLSIDASGNDVGDVAVSMGMAVGLRLLMTLVFLTLFFAVIQFFSFAWKNSTSVIVTLVALVTMVASMVIIPEALEWGNYGDQFGVENPENWERLNPLFYFQNERIMIGDLGIGLPLVLLLETVGIGVIVIVTSSWMKRREL